MGFGMALKSQISACESSPAVQICTEECGAHAKAFTGDVCPDNSATGTEGTLKNMSNNANIHT